MKLITHLVILFVFAAPAIAQLNRDQLPPEMSSQISDAQLELTNWMMFYYKRPVPDEFPGWLKKASAEGMFRDEKRQFPFLGFAATVFATNTDEIPQWMNTIDTLPEDDRKTILIALWLSGTKVSQSALSDASQNKLLRENNYFNLDTSKEPPDLGDINKYWGFLDIQWGWFLASGDIKPVENIVSVFELANYMGSRNKYPQPKTEEQKDAYLKDTLFGTALWSLRSNCRLHPKLVEICETIYNERKFNRLAQLTLKSILIEYMPDKYKIEGSSNMRLHEYRS